MGRCNRTGDDGPGRVIVIDLEEKHSLPYSAEDLTFARSCVGKLEGKSVSPQSLDEFKRRENLKLPFEHKHVLRRRDLIDLFDTAPDLSGNDIDISRFIRGDDPDTDVQVFWRNLGIAAPKSDEPGENRRELCSVPAGKELREFLKKLKDKKGLFGHVWDHLDEAWRQLRDPEREIRPGQTILLPAAAGGYSLDLGWDAESTASVEPVDVEIRQAAEGTGSDPNSCGLELTVAQHTQNVCAELEALLAIPGLSEEWRKHLGRAARWHDAGKAHPVFQRTMRKANPKLNDSQLWAKSGTSGRLFHGRRHFRHELASALAALQHGLPFEVAYLIATHHGKVRLSIRTLPDEGPQPDDAETMFAQGVWNGDQLPEIDLGGEMCGAVTIDLSPMRLGGETSWSGRALALRDVLGPFRLAYLEALLRAADVRASKNERKELPNA
jgi:CRISPR-associated endonuclease/helicase Cas3